MSEQVGIPTAADEVTVIGLGAMGAALAGAFLKRNIPTHVWNRSPEKADALVARGAVRTAAVRDALAASKLVFVCLLNYDTVYKVLDQGRDALAGRTLVNLSNGTPAQAREMAQWAADRGAEYVDGGIMAIPPLIGQPQALILYSGSPDAFERHRSYLEILGMARYLGRDAGLASLYDLALLAAMWGMFAGALHAVALVDTEKVGARQFMPLLMPWLTVMSQSLTRLAEQVDAGDYTTGVASNLAMQAVASANLVEASKAQGVSTKLIAPMHDLMNAAVAAGYGKAGLSSLIALIRKP